MSITYTAMWFALCALAPVSQPAQVRGSIPIGGHIEFLAPGLAVSTHQTAEPNPKGKYLIELAPGRYEITYVSKAAKRFVATVVIPEGTTELNALPEEKGPAGDSGQEFDFLADWKIFDKSKQGLSAKVMLEAELSNGRGEEIVAWVLSGTGDEEKETGGKFETTPDGRVLFRVRESRLRPDRITALRLKIEAPGHPAFTERIRPVLEFSAGGHFHAVYPEQYEIILP